MWVPVFTEWTTKPPLGTPLRAGHWSTDGIIVCEALNERAGAAIYNSVDGNQAVFSSTPTWAADSVNLSSNNAPYQVAKHNTPMVTVISRLRIASGGAAATAVACGNGGTGYGWTLNRKYNAQAQMQFSARLGTSWASATTDVNIIGAGWVTLAGIAGGGVGRKIYVDGRLSGSSALAGNVSYVGGGNRLRIGNDDATTNPWTGDVGYVLVYSRILSDFEIQSLSINPWQVYAPKVFWVNVGGGGASAALFDGSINGSTTMSAGLATSISMSGVSTGTGSATANIATAISLAAQILASGISTGSITTKISLSGSTVGAASALGDILTAIRMAATSAGIGSMTGAMDGLSAALLSGVLSGTGVFSGNILTAIPLAGSALGEGLTQAQITTAVALAAAAQGNAQAQASLTTAIMMSAQINAQGSASAVLAGALAILGFGFTLPAETKGYVVPAETRGYAI